MRGYFSWFFALVPGSDQVEAFRGWEREEVDGSTAEIKRLYVDPRYRGRTIGQQLVQWVPQKARSLGYRRMLLHNHCSMVQAHAVYRAAGFLDVAAPHDFPEELKPVVVFMARGL